MTRRFVVSGTDTNVGKTVFSAGLAGALNGYYWKPIQSGFAPEGDKETVMRLSGLPASHILPERYRLTAPLSPHRSAEMDGVVIQPATLTLPEVAGPLVIEGAGGLMVPITREFLQIDLYRKWDLPVILVARTTLGTINHTLLSIAALRMQEIPLHGVAFVGEDNSDNIRTIGEMGDVRVLGRLPHLPQLNAHTLRDAFTTHFREEDFS
ncbi:MAG: ATP-dependent dethiobiotin synthetase BioD [Hyphomicrobium sp.]|nr:ATP-dependent dethiobiotin synthetase BioD [Hyphomicrobium sp.]PPD09078.1 MAG: dethiobiotin synthase [Hyphomicrobium sp.]